MSDSDPTAPGSDLVGPTLFPNNNRRRIPGVLYVLIGLGCGIAWLLRRDHDPVLVDGGFLLATGLLIGIGLYCLWVGSNLATDEEAALEAVAGAVDQPIGHASAQMGWRGWSSRPTWRILWYSAEDPPVHRGLALVDGRDGRVLESLIEKNPEDWQHLDGRLDRTD